MDLTTSHMCARAHSPYLIPPPIPTPVPLTAMHPTPTQIDPHIPTTQCTPNVRNTDRVVGPSLPAPHLDRHGLRRLFQQLSGHRGHRGALFLGGSVLIADLNTHIYKHTTRPPPKKKITHAYQCTIHKRWTAAARSTRTTSSPRWGPPT